MAKKLPIQAALAAAKEEAKKDKKTSAASVKTNSAAAAEIAKKAGAQASALALGAGLHSSGTAARAKQTLQNTLAAQAAATQGVPVRQGSITQMPTAAPGKNQFVTLPGTPQTGSLASNATLLNNTTAGPVNRNSASTLDMDTLFSDTLKRLQADFNTYAGHGPQQKQEIADGLVGGAITGPGKGNVGALDWDALIDMEIMNATISQQMAASGAFNDPFYALNSQYVTLPSFDYKQGLLGEKEAALADSIKKDDEEKRKDSDRQGTYLGWQQLESENKNGTADPWYNMLYADYLLGDRSEPFNFDWADYEFQQLDPAAQEERKAYLENQWNTLDWDTLTGRNYTPYESATPGLQAEVDMLQDEVSRLEELTAMEEMLRSNPQFDALSVYQDTYTPVEKGTLEYIFGNDAFVNGLDDQQRYINSPATHAQRQIAAEYSGAVKNYMSKGLEFLTPDERKMFNVAMSISEETGAKYLELKAPELLMRRANVNAEFTSTAATNPWLAAPMAVASVGAGLMTPFQAIPQAVEALTGKDDPNSSSSDYSRFQQDVRGAQEEWIGEAGGPSLFGKTLWQHLYSGGLGAVDNLARIGLYGPQGSLWAAGAQSASGSLQENADRDNMSGAAKIIQALLTAGAEIGTEKIGLDALFDKGKKNAFNYIKGVIGAELGEETLNYLTDDMIDLAVSTLFDHEADIKSAPEFWQGLGETAINTLISSSLMGGSGAIAQSVDNRATGQSIQQQGDPEKLVEIAKSMPEGSEARAIAMDIEARVGKGKKPPLGKLGQMAKALDGELNQEYADITNGVMEEAIEQRLVELGTDQEAAKRNAVAIRKMVYGEKLTIKERAAVAWDDNADQVTKEVFGKATEKTEQPQRRETATADLPPGIRDHDLGKNTDKFVDTRGMDKPSTRKAQVVDIEDRLGAIGINQEEAQKLAPIIQKEFRGEELTKEEQAYIEGNEEAEQVVNELNYEQREQQIQVNEENSETLLEIAAGMPEGSTSESIARETQQRIEARDQKTMTFHEFAELATSMISEVTNKGAATIKRMLDQAIENRLIEYGESKFDAKKVARILRKLALGESVSISERLMLNSIGTSKNDILNEFQVETEFKTKEIPRKKEPYYPAWVTEAKRAQIDAAGEVIGKRFRARAAAKTKNVSQTVKDVSQTVKDAAAKGAAKVRKGKDGKPVGKLNARKVYFDNGTSRGEGDILRFEEQEDGLKMIVQTGKTDKETTAVGLDALTEADGAGTAGIIEAVQDINDTLHPVSAEEANAMLTGYDAVGGDAATFVENYERAYLAGYSGDEVPSIALDSKLGQIAAGSGRRQAELDEEKRKQRASAYKAVEKPMAGWIGTVSSDAEVRGSGDAEALSGALEAMTESQRMTAEAAVEFGKAVGLNVVLYESDANHISSIKNGSFKESTHTVYLDVNSGAGSAKDIQAQKESGTLGYAIMRTLGHEVTHYLEVASPEMYGKYKAAVKEGLKAAGEDVAQLIRGKIDNALNDGRKLTYAAAEAEVIADASEYMLQDSKFTNDLDPTLKGRIKTFIQNFMGKVKEILTNLTGAHRESKALREMVDGVYHYTRKLQELWDASLQETLSQEASDHSGGATEMVEGQAATEGTQFSMRDEDLNYASATDEDFHRNGRIYDYDFLVAQKPISVVTIPSVNTLMGNGRFSRSDVVEAGKAGIPGAANEQGHKKVTNAYTGRSLTITNNSIRHGLNGDKPRLLANAQIGMVIGDVVKNGIPVNGLVPTDGNALQTYAMVTPCITEDGKRMMAVTHVDIQKNEVNSVTFTDIVHSANGRIYKNSEPVSNTIDVEGESPYHPSRYTISISDLLRDVNTSFKSLLSQDVLEHLGEVRPENGAYSNKVLYSDRDLPADITVRDYLAELKPTDRMNETEKLLLKRYQDTLGKLREAERNATEQNDIIKTATGDELTKAKNRWQIYRNQANRYARELARAERNEGFAGLMATGQKLVNQYLTGGYNRIADAQDALETEIRSLGEQLKAIGKTVESAERGQKTAHARGLFNQGELNAAAKRLKDSYGSRMSIKEISNRLALAYGEIYASNGAEGAKRFTDAAKDLAQDIMASSKYRYRSETLTMIAEEIPTISLTETDKQEIKNTGLTISEYKRGISPFVKVTDGASDLSSYVSNAEAYGGQIVNILGTDTEGDLAMALYNVIQAEKQAEGAGTFEGMTEGESLSAVMVDIVSANLPMTTNSSTLDYLRKEMLKYAGESQAAAKAVEGAIQSVKNATKRASSLWHRAVQEVELSERAIDYYRALEEQRRLMELQDQKKELTEQLKSDAAKKIHEQVEKQRAEYREREQRAREYRKTRDEVDKLRRGIGRKVKRLNALRVRETDQKHVPQELQHVADLVMQTFTDSSLGRLAFSQERLNSLSHRYQMLKELESDSTYFWDDEIEMDITNLQALGEAYGALRNRESDVPSRFSLEGVELETEILQGVDAIVSNVMQMIDSANDAFLTQRNETFDQFANQTGEKLLAHDDHKVLKGVLGKIQNMLDETIRTGNVTPIYFFEHLQNQELLDVFNELRIGQNYYAQIVAEGKDFVQAAKEKHNYGKWVADGKLKMKTGQGHVIELTREEAVEIYAIAKREQANKLYQTEHLLYGGFQYKNIQDKVSEDGKTQQTDKPHQLDKADIARISEWLTAEQKAYADEMVGFLSTTMADYGNQASMDMYGYRKFTEQYYIPFHTVAEQRHQRGDEGPQGENAGTGRVKNSGFTKKLQHKANQPLLVGGLTDTVADHIHKMAAYSAMVQPIENMKRLLNHKVLESDGTANTVRALIGQKYGKASQDYLTQLLKDANGATMSDQRAAALTDKLVGAFKRGAVMASASVVLQQPTAAARAMAYISPKYFAQNPFYRPSKGTWDEMMKYSGTAVIKDMGKFDVGMGLTASQYIADENINMFEAYQRLKADSKTKAGKAAYDRFMAWLTAAPGKADQWTWGLIWKAVKAEQAALHPEMDVNSEAFLQMCGARFDDVIDHTQVYDSVLTRSNLMRSTNALHKMATSFMSEPTLSLNMLYDALTGKHGKKQGARIIGSVVASQVLAGALAALAQAWNDDDDERNWLEKYADRATGNILDNLNPLGMIPYVSDIVSLFEGYDVERPDMSVIADIYDYSKTFFKAFEDGGTPSWKQIENFAGTLANLVGVPAKNISREIRRTRNAIWNTDRSTPNSFNVGHAMLENTFWYSEKNTDYYQRMVTAHLNGDTELEEDFRTYMLTSKMVSEESLANGLQTAMQDRYLDGDVDDDTAIKYLLQIGKADDEEDAYWTVNKWQYMKETGNTAQSYRKYDEFFTAVENGANLKATIQTYLDNGVSKSTLATQITNQYKKQLIALKQSGKGYADLQARLLTAYEALGYDRNKKLKDIQKWFEED